MKNPLNCGLAKKYEYYAKLHCKQALPKIIYVRNMIEKIIYTAKESFSKNPFVYIVAIFLFCWLFKSDSIYGVSFILFLASLIVIGNKYINNKHEEFIIVTDFSGAIKELDTLIADSIQEYMIMSGLAQTDYITDKLETQIRTESSKLVTAKLSTALYKKLCYQYSEESVYTVIAARIYLIIMNFTIQTNQKSRNNDTVTELNKHNQVSLF